MSARSEGGPIAAGGCPPNGDDAPSIEQFVDELIGTDVDAPEIKSRISQMLGLSIDVINGK